MKSAPKGWLGPYDTPMELHQMVMSDRPFSCHSAQDRDVSFDEVGSKRYPICKGSVIYMRKNAKRHSNPKIQKMIESVTEEEKKETFSLPQFMEHHTFEK